MIRAANVRAVAYEADCGRCGASLVNGEGSFTFWPGILDDLGEVCRCPECGAENMLPERIFKDRRTT